MPIAPELLHRVSRAFDASGFKEYVTTLRKFIRHVRINRKLRKSYGKLRHLETRPLPMSLSTNAYYSFLLYLYCVGGSLVFFILENAAIISALCVRHFQNGIRAIIGLVQSMERTWQITQLIWYQKVTNQS